VTVFTWRRWLALTSATTVGGLVALRVYTWVLVKALEREEDKRRADLFRKSVISLKKRSSTASDLKPRIILPISPLSLFSILFTVSLLKQLVKLAIILQFGRELSRQLRARS
jgi:hypothetical protein